MRGRAERDGWRVLQAAGVEAERPFALERAQPDGLRTARRTGPDSTRDQREVLAPVFGADPVQAPSPLALAVALLDLLTVAAREQPLLLIVEDAHWLDELSAMVLSAAGRRVSHDPGADRRPPIRPRTGAVLSPRVGTRWFCSRCVTPTRRTS